MLKRPVRRMIIRAFQKTRDRLFDCFNYRLAARYGTCLSDGDFLKKLKVQKHVKAATGEEAFKNTATDLISTNRIFWSIFDENEFESINDFLEDKEKEKILNFAEEICGHWFDLLGSGKVKQRYNLKTPGVEGFFYDNHVNPEIIKAKKEAISNVLKGLFDFNETGGKRLQGYFDGYELIDWQQDFKSGFRWDENNWYKNIQYGRKPGVDVKVPWELSRFQHLVAMGQAYIISKDEKYTCEFICEMIDWILSNTPQYGVNWKCTMDVAIRAANWIAGFAYFRESPLITDDFRFYFFKNIFIHGRHIVRNLEYSTVTSNHYLSDIAGLLFISHLFDLFEAGKKWKRFALQQLKREVQKQVYEDGFDFEASTCYHRLVLEIIFYSVFFSIKKEATDQDNDFYKFACDYFGEPFIEKMHRMFKALVYIAKPDGTIPQIGDNDSGRFLIFENSGQLNTGYLVTPAAIFFNDPDLKVNGSGFSNSAVWLYGTKSFARWQGTNEYARPGLDVKALKNAGIYVMRKGKTYLLVSCGPNGQNGNGGHAHNDRCSFELFAGDNALIVDPGTYIYTPLPDERNLFRSTAYHNTVLVDSIEQNGFINGNLFTLNDDSKTICNLWRNTEEHDFLEVQHSGYMRLNDPVMHRRRFIFSKKDSCVIIQDILSCSEYHQFNYFFHLAPDIKKQGIEVLPDGKTARISINPHNIFTIAAFSDDQLSLSLEEGYYSGGYGLKTDACILKYSGKGKNTGAIFLLTLQEAGRIKDQFENAGRLLEEIF